MNNFRRFTILMGLTFILLVGILKTPVFAQSQSTQQEAPTVYNLEIGTGEFDTPLFTVNITALPPSSQNTSDTGIAENTVKGVAQGSGEISSNVKPPAASVIIRTNLEGTYTISPFLVHDTHPINFDLTGFPSIDFPKAGGIGPVILPNVKLNINLTGYGPNATYEYRTNPEEPWQTVNNVPVKIVSVE